jgi:cytochrome c peroxidase
MGYRSARAAFAVSGLVLVVGSGCSSSNSSGGPKGNAGDNGSAGFDNNGAGNAGAAAAAGDTGPADLAGAAGASDEAPTLTSAELAALAELSPKALPSPLPDMSNRFADDAQAAALGQKLFFETRFSGKLLDGDDDGSANALGKQGETGKVACAGCHIAKDGFLDDRTLGKQVSLAAGWGRRRAPSLLDVGQAKLLMWDGRHDTLYNQPFGPIESPVEMNSSRLFVAEQIFALYRPEYEAVFGPLPAFDDVLRFPPLAAELTGCQPSTADPQPACNGTEHGLPGDSAEFDALAKEDQDAVTEVVVNLGKALGAYERLLDCGASRFDAWVGGKSDALTASEQRGAQLFVGRGQCVSCHSGPFLSDQKFHNVGLQPTTVAVVFIDQDDHGALTGLAAANADPLNSRGKFSDGDDGRLPKSVAASMEGAFRTPILRCAARRPSFMHTGQLMSLSDVVAFFAKGGDSFGFLGTSELTALDLSARDEQDLVAFLGALEGPGPSADLLSDTRTP